MAKILYVEPKFHIVKYKLTAGKYYFDKFVTNFISEIAAKIECDAMRKAYFPHCDTTGKAVYRVEKQEGEEDSQTFIVIH